MSSRVTIINKTEFCFKASTVLLCEAENSVEKYWETKASDSLIPKGGNIVFGKLIHPDHLPNSANLIASIILSRNEFIEEGSQEKFLVLKARIKNSKTGVKVYRYASCFPENVSITKPQWYKGSAKNIFLTRIFGKNIQITHKISWNDNISFLIEELIENPVVCRLSRSENGFILDDFYENQWKGHSKYTHNPISVHSHRPAYSTVNGGHVLPKSQIMPPTSMWAWTDDWHLDTIMETPDGWIYIDNWNSFQIKEENSTKFRFRRWIRTRTLKNNIVSNNVNTLEFISDQFRRSVSILGESLPPFLKELKNEVAERPCDFDMGSLSAIPSPRLRRELQVYIV